MPSLANEGGLAVDEATIWHLIDQWIKRRVSDIYLIPQDNHYRLLTLIDGHLTQEMVLSKGRANQMIMYFKYHADMAVAEHRRPQAGALRYEARKVDLRISTVGDFRGFETLVIRIIYPLGDEYQLLYPNQWDQLVDMTKKRGMILFSGPMGSGKTTTMYRLASQFSQQEVVLSIEDPVEIYQPDFIQLQVNELAGMDYQSLLRLGLRHRPGVFIIGEVRDGNTAKIAIQAALSGHLVLATVHAQSAAGVIIRLKQLGIAQDQLEQAVVGVCYQRLAKTSSGKVAVLMDQLSGRQLLTQMQDKKLGGVSDEWHELVKQAVIRQQISPAEGSRLQAG